MNSQLNLSLAALLISAMPAWSSVPNAGNSYTFPILTSVAAAPNGGYWVQVHDYKNKDAATRTVAIGGAPAFDSVDQKGSIAAIPGQNGYWVVGAKGAIIERGSAPRLCNQNLSSCSGYKLDASGHNQIAAAAASPDGGGLWAVSLYGQVWTAGNTRSYGDMVKQAGMSSDTFPTAIVPTPSGQGYYLVAADGGVFSLGDAVFFGSTGGKKPDGKRISGLTLSKDASGKVNGYWLLAEDGHAWAYGQAPNLPASAPSSSMFTGIAGLPQARGYVVVHDDGLVQAHSLPRTTITLRSSGKDLDVQGGAADPGTPLVQTRATGSGTQHWDIWPTTAGAGYVQLRNATTGLCMDVSASSFQQIVQWPCKTAGDAWDNQLWQMIAAADGSGTLLRPKSDSSFLLGAQSNDEGVPVVLIQTTSIVDYNTVTWSMTSAPTSAGETCATPIERNHP